MIQYQNWLNKNLSEAFKKRVSERTSHMVSTCAMANLMGVPEVAVKAIARKAGIVQSEWIDVDSLGVYEDTYIRKLKTYFKRMMRNANEMGYDELRTFISFCKTFKKPNIETSKICCWEDIDEDAIREQFKSDVEDEYQRHSSHERFECMSVDMAFQIRTERENHDSRTESFNIVNNNTQHQHNHRNVLRAVTLSQFYRSKIIRRNTKNWHEREEYKAFFITAHYYIYCREDKEDHHVDTILENRPYWRFFCINSTLMVT